MKAMKTLLGITASALLTLHAWKPAQAGPMEGLGTWRGDGVVFALDGQAQGNFKVQLTRSQLDATTVQSRGAVTLDDGHVIPIDQRFFTRGGNTFGLESNRGKGGGLCFGEGLCQSYEDVGDDKGYATTIVVDGQDKLRVIVTELDHGRAVRFMRQTLVRK